ncbi:hypothetical protein [Rhizobium ruizarguesonis]|uniref:Uncharacterized protein n=1 Tax=Rhizobium ruizarguesonis TaxID=2081791 RepID=A0AAE8Q4M3_9HYPH|nr:hypothetical protein [Rhizobium ruizarguesonis]TBC12716.1 hypothetical protein ELH35_38095 [Rhizobium ruizarguesonis]TBF00962.1 hypothetical protein ELG94_39510 [Rhizobium ruizarguesonis]
MKLLETAIRAIIDDHLKKQTGEIYRKLYGNRDIYGSGELRKLAETEIDSLSNSQLLELLDRLLDKQSA